MTTRSAPNQSRFEEQSTNQRYGRWARICVKSLRMSLACTGMHEFIAMYSPLED
jgi:hypothetical protein